jgi:hypothetical protein
LATDAPKRVIVFLSYENILPLPQNGSDPCPADSATADRTRLRVRPDGGRNLLYPLGRAQDLVFGTLTVRALKDSLTTAIPSLNKSRNYQTGDGFELYSPEQTYSDDEGSAAAAAYRNGITALRFVTCGVDLPWRTEPVADMIQAAWDAGAEIILMIAPGHADEIELRRQLGLNERVNAWRANLVHTVEDAQQSRVGHRVELWDFAGFSLYTMEPMPAADDPANHLRWFWDPVHFVPALGERMIERLDRGGPQEFGMQLTGDVLAEADAAFSAAQRQWIEAHPADVQRIATVIAAARQTLGETRKQCAGVSQ